MVWHPSSSVLSIDRKALRLELRRVHFANEPFLPASFLPDAAEGFVEEGGQKPEGY